MVACGSRTMLYKDGYLIFRGLSAAHVSSQNLVLVPSNFERTLSKHLIFNTHEASLKMRVMGFGCHLSESFGS